MNLPQYMDSGCFDCLNSVHIEDFELFVFVICGCDVHRRARCALKGFEFVGAKVWASHVGRLSRTPRMHNDDKSPVVKRAGAVVSFVLNGKYPASRVRCRILGGKCTTDKQPSSLGNDEWHRQIGDNNSVVQLHSAYITKAPDRFTYTPSAHGTKRSTEQRARLLRRGCPSTLLQDTFLRFTGGETGVMTGSS